MGKTQTYTDDQLLDAVIRYAEEFSGKIYASDLARWASSNISGLEGVRYYHFVRPVKTIDPKTGKKTEKKKLCTQRIDELNKARSVVYSVKQNVLLRSSRVDAFLELPVQTQRKMIIDTREQVDTLIKKNLYLTRSNKQLSAENQALLAENQSCKDKLNALTEKQKRLSMQVSALLNTYGEDSIRIALDKIGVTDQGFDLKKYTDSLTLDLQNVFSINTTIKKAEENHDSGFVDDIMKGLDF